MLGRHEPQPSCPTRQGPGTGVCRGSQVHLAALPRQIHPSPPTSDLITRYPPRPEAEMPLQPSYHSAPIPAPEDAGIPAQFQRCCTSETGARNSRFRDLAAATKCGEERITSGKSPAPRLPPLRTAPAPRGAKEGSGISPIPGCKRRACATGVTFPLSPSLPQDHALRAKVRACDPQPNLRLRLGVYFPPLLVRRPAGVGSAVAQLSSRPFYPPHPTSSRRRA